jgi:ribonuclease III
MVFERFPEADEGQLSRLRARLASRAILARAIERLDLLPHCLVGSQMGASWPDSVKANLMESLFAAVFLDGGFQALRTAVERAVAPYLDDPESGRDDPRMRLQAWCLEHHKRLPEYTCERSGGTDHEPQFTATAAIAGASAAGSGTSRRRAEAAAAEALLATIAAGLPPVA